MLHTVAPNDEIFSKCTWNRIEDFAEYSFKRDFPGFVPEAHPNEPYIEVPRLFFYQMALPTVH